MRRSAGHGDCTIGKDTQGNIYRRRSRRALRADQYFRSVHAGGRGIMPRPILAAVDAMSANFATMLWVRIPLSPIRRASWPSVDGCEPWRAAPSPGCASSGGARPRMGITDPRGDIAGDPAAGYGRFQLGIIRLIIIFHICRLPRNRVPGRNVESWREESNFSPSLYIPNNGVCVVHYPFEYYCNVNNIIIFNGEYEKRRLEYYPRCLYKTEEPQFLLVPSTNTVNLLLSPLPQI